MKFSAFKEYRDDGKPSLPTVTWYLGTELAGVLRELRTLLTKLTFGDNFESFEVALTIQAGEEFPVRNQLRDSTPSKWILVRTNEAGLSVCDGDTPWDQTFLYLKNTHATDVAQITVVFLR